MRRKLVQLLACQEVSWHLITPILGLAKFSSFPNQLSTQKREGQGRKNRQQCRRKCPSHNKSGELLIELDRNLSKCLLGDKKQTKKNALEPRFPSFPYFWTHLMVSQGEREEAELTDNHRAIRAGIWPHCGVAVKAFKLEADLRSFYHFYTHIPHRIIIALLQSKNKKEYFTPLDIKGFYRTLQAPIFLLQKFHTLHLPFSPWNSRNMVQHCHWETELSLG